eukprot:TRINITY_DN4130_c0_g1_i1.p1 TRINITY_DN4130_c0_g1~~TRINITY_DN4130_c0_g1_i1.p1  ORF type:complete len:174 (+),score=31.16 TRINITY_DN4130_c0_g1_i1:78-599(+)
MADENAAATEHLNGVNGSSPVAVSFSSFKLQLVVKSQKASEAVQFYKAAFGAEEVNRSTHPKRKAEQELPLIICAELKIGPSVFLVCDQMDETASAADEPKGNADGTGLTLCLETDDVDNAIATAVEAGAVLETAITGDEESDGSGRFGKVKDPFGYIWNISSVGSKVADVEA